MIDYDCFKQIVLLFDKWTGRDRSHGQAYYTVLQEGVYHLRSVPLYERSSYRSSILPYEAFGTRVYDLDQEVANSSPSAYRRFFTLVGPDWKVVADYTKRVRVFGNVDAAYDALVMIRLKCL